MNNQKKGKSKLTGFFARRQFRYGGYATVLTAIVIAVVILLNVAIGAIETNWALSIDVTAIGATDFDEQTEKVVAEVAQPVKVYTLYKDSTTASSLRIQVEEVLNKYRAMNNNITIENIDPVKEPARVSQYAGDEALSEGAIILTNEDGTRVKLINREDYYYYYTSSYTGQTLTIFDLESKMTGALLYVTSEETPRVFYLAGHDELDSAYCSVLTQQLENQNYDVSTLNLTNDKDITLVPGDTIVVLSPSRDLTDAEYGTLRTWLATGGRMLFALNYEIDASVLVNFTKLLDYYQLSFGEGIVMEDAAATTNWNSDRYTLVPNMDAEHDVTAALVTNNAYMMVPNARPINAVAMPESGLQFTNLLTTSANAVVMNDDESSLPGTQTLAMAMLKQNDYEDPSKDIRIALVGSIYTMADTSLLNYSYNMNFTTNLFNWLVNRENSLEIDSKLIANDTLAIPDSATAWTLAAVIVVAIPLTVLVVGVVVWMKRRRL